MLIQQCQMTSLYMKAMSSVSHHSFQGQFELHLKFSWLGPIRAWM